MPRPTRFTVISCIVCAAVAAFIAAHDVAPEQRLGAALLGVLWLAVVTTITVLVARWAERRSERRDKDRQ